MQRLLSKDEESLLLTVTEVTVIFIHPEGYNLSGGGERVADQMNSKGPFQPQTFCDAVKQ